MLSSVEKWVIGSDKKPQFQIFDETDDAAIPLALFSGYGVIIYSGDGAIAGKFGINMDGYSSGEVSVIDETTFEVSLDKSLNTIRGLVNYRVVVTLPDADFSDTNQEISSGIGVIYNSVN